MTKIDLGRIGAVIDPSSAQFADTATALDGMGYETIWLSGGPLQGLDQIATVVRATERARVATGILSVDRFGADDVAALHAELDADHPGRFVVGLGGAHGPRPFATLNAYLDRLDATSVRADVRVLAALGPRMLDLAAERAAGAFPVFVTPDYTRTARARLGDETTLAVDQLVAVDADPDRARSVARGPMGFFTTVPQYQASFRRQGFSDDEISTGADRLVDALVPNGDAASVAVRAAAQLEAGADHVALSLTTDKTPADALSDWRALAGALGLG